jgi:hypothetical protein
MRGGQVCHLQWQCDSFDGYYAPKPAQLGGEVDSNHQSRHQSNQKDSSDEEDDYN